MAAPIETSSYRVEQVGPWTAADIHIEFDPAEFQPPVDRADWIDRSWEAEKAEAHRLGFEMFNGKLARLVCAAGQGGRLDLTLQPTDFRTFLATNLLEPDRFADSERANAMGVSSIMRCIDARLVFGRRSQRVAYNRGKLHTIGGVLDWIRPGETGSGEVADGGWLFDQLEKELNEELGLEPEEIRELAALALVRDKRIWQPELLCVTEISLTGDELSDRWRRTGEYEHADLWGCHDSPGAMAEALAHHVGEFTPIGVAAMVAYLSVRHGLGGLEALAGGA